jgi:hypothetical protein
MPRWYCHALISCCLRHKEFAQIPRHIANEWNGTRLVIGLDERE